LRTLPCLLRNSVADFRNTGSSQSGRTRHRD